MAGAKRRAPERQPAPVDVGAGAHERQRGAPIVELLRWIDDLPRQTTAGSETAVVENERRNALAREPFRGHRQTNVTGAGKAMGHHNDRRPGTTCWQIEPAGAHARATWETQIESSDARTQLLLRHCGCRRTWCPPVAANCGERDERYEEREGDEDATAHVRSPGQPSSWQLWGRDPPL